MTILYRTLLAHFVLFFFIFASPTFAQTISLDHEQLCRIVMTGRQKVYPLGDAYNKETNPIAKKELLQRWESVRQSSNDLLRTFLARPEPLQEIAGTITHFGANTLGGSGAFIKASVKCDKIAYLGDFSMRFDGVAGYEVAAIEPFVSTLRSLKINDQILFGGNIFSGNDRNRYSYGSPQLFHFDLITTMMRKL
jgi:hypothetical protein